MDTNEIRALIAQKIAGQGSMVDVGGGLPAILNAIVELLPDGDEKVTFDLTEYTVQGNVIGVSENVYNDILDAIKSEKKVLLKVSVDGRTYFSSTLSFPETPGGPISFIVGSIPYSVLID